ncbi:FKBP-type peptidyl-prolyl cis-trans isomerase [Flavobacterium flavipallidum]|uniref:FKBP-type peptidylprolyl isomerase n=1 Tax=Flavobacterium flavipallidum TaxID=3139140 RepID=A0ABU9HJW0_9FLAO
MNKFKYYFIVIITSLFLFSCSKDDNSFTTEPLKDYGEQYKIDSVAIKEYLDTYYLDIDINDPNFADNDVVIKKITSTVTKPSIMSYLNSSTFPKLLKKEVELHDITYTLYYLVLREGTGEQPCNVDGVLAAYSGDYIYRTTATETVPSELLTSQFEKVIYPQSFLYLYQLVTGWGEVFPEFRIGTATSKSDGTVEYNNFGAGVMFLPSGLGYYGSGQGTIPSYSPLVFSFKLYAINRSDLDGDGIPSYLEDLNGDGYLRSVATTNNPLEDTDGDGISDFLDTDDDGDGYSTKYEITVNKVVTPYADIPDCSGNTTNPARIKKYLDKNCH